MHRRQPSETRSEAIDRKRARYARAARQRLEEKEDEVVISSDDSFPASDPPSWIGVTGEGRHAKRH